MIGLSALMVSNVRYPSFKKIDFQTRGNVVALIAGSLFIVLLLNEQTRWYTPTIVFSLYLVYGLVRPVISKRWRKSFEEAVDGS